MRVVLRLLKLSVVGDATVQRFIGLEKIFLSGYRHWCKPEGKMLRQKYATASVSHRTVSTRLVLQPVEELETSNGPDASDRLRTILRRPGLGLPALLGDPGNVQ